MNTDLIVDFPHQGLQQRTVVFDEFSQMTVVENIAIGYKDSVWLSKDETNEIRRQYWMAMRTVMFAPGCGMEKYQRFEGDDSICLIGAENFITPSMTAKALKHRQDHIKTVLFEQDRQLRFGKTDPIKICSVSQKSSEWASERAITIAKLVRSAVEDES
ncbi:hypothetical protein ACHAXS_000391 [Conticribra weissflogii]